jgi:spermidine synthase
MATDNVTATQNQKVFISLASVVRLATEYNRVCSEIERLRAKIPTAPADSINRLVIRKQSPWLGN